MDNNETTTSTNDTPAVDQATSEAVVRLLQVYISTKTNLRELGENIDRALLSQLAAITGAQSAEGEAGANGTANAA